MLSPGFHWVQFKFKGLIPDWPLVRLRDKGGSILHLDCQVINIVFPKELDKRAPVDHNLNFSVMDLVPLVMKFLDVPVHSIPRSGPNSLDQPVPCIEVFSDQH